MIGSEKTHPNTLVAVVSHSPVSLFSLRPSSFNLALHDEFADELTIICQTRTDGGKQA